MIKRKKFFGLFLVITIFLQHTTFCAYSFFESENKNLFTKIFSAKQIISKNKLESLNNTIKSLLKNKTFLYSAGGIGALFGLLVTVLFLSKKSGGKNSGGTGPSGKDVLSKPTELVIDKTDLDVKTPVDNKNNSQGANNNSPQNVATGSVAVQNTDANAGHVEPKNNGLKDVPSAQTQAYGADQVVVPVQNSPTVQDITNKEEKQPSLPTEPSVTVDSSSSAKTPLLAEPSVTVNSQQSDNIIDQKQETPANKPVVAANEEPTQKDSGQEKKSVEAIKEEVKPVVAIAKEKSKEVSAEQKLKEEKKEEVVLDESKNSEDSGKTHKKGVHHNRNENQTFVLHTLLDAEIEEKKTEEANLAQKGEKEDVKEDSFKIETAEEPVVLFKKPEEKKELLKNSSNKSKKEESDDEEEGEDLDLETEELEPLFSIYFPDTVKKFIRVEYNLKQEEDLKRLVNDYSKIGDEKRSELEELFKKYQEENKIFVELLKKKVNNSEVVVDDCSNKDEAGKKYKITRTFSSVNEGELNIKEWDLHDKKQVEDFVLYWDKFSSLEKQSYEDTLPSVVKDAIKESDLETKRKNIVNKIRENFVDKHLEVDAEKWNEAKEAAKTFKIQVPYRSESGPRGAHDRGRTEESAEFVRSFIENRDLELYNLLCKIFNDKKNCEYFTKEEFNELKGKTPDLKESFDDCNKLIGLFSNYAIWQDKVIYFEKKQA